MIGFVYVSAVILFAVSIIHFYWAFGGKWGGREAVPQKGQGEALFIPRKPETLAVAVLVLVVGFALLAQAGQLPGMEPNGLTRWACILCSVVFFVRAVGEFKYLGFFKRIRETRFAKYHTRFYSPLCLFLSLSFILTLTSL